MKIKDLEGFNPEAEIQVIMPNYLPFEGKLTYGWSSGDGGDSPETLDRNKATEVCIFLGDINENIGKA